MSILNNLINGISLGSVYAIIALGYTMVYGIAKMLNFAHGDVIMVGAYICFFTMSGLSGSFEEGSLAGAVVPALAGVLLAMVVCTVLGMVIERLAYKPLRQAPSLAVLITAIGVSYFLQNSALLLWTSNPKSFSSVVGTGSIKLLDGQLTITHVALVTVAACIVIMLGLTWFTGHTRMGKAMRATAQNRKMAMLLGINTDHLISVTFIVGSALAAIGGVLIASHMGQINFFIGFLAGMKAFTAAVLGGIGSVPGAVLGGLVLGLAESFTTGYIAGNYEDVLSFCLLILILIFRPDGLLGKKQVQKV